MKTYIIALTLLSSIALSVAFSTYAHADEEAYKKELIYRIQASGTKDVAQLLPYVKQLDITDESGWPILSIAAARTDKEALGIVKVLVKAGANVNYGGPRGQYALASAIQSENPNIVSYLLEEDADYNAKMLGGVKISDIAFQSGQPDIVRLIQTAVESDRTAHLNSQSQANLNRLSYNLAYNSCALQYFSYYYSSKQDDIPQSEQTATLKKYNNGSSVAMTDLARLFKIRKDLTEKLFLDARESTFIELENLVSNRYRREVGVGTIDDMDKRCKPIATPYLDEYFNKATLQPQYR